MQKHEERTPLGQIVQSISTLTERSVAANKYCIKNALLLHLEGGVNVGIVFGLAKSISPNAIECEAPHLPRNSIELTYEPCA